MVLDRDVDPHDEPRDSSERTEVPGAGRVAKIGNRGGESEPRDHEDLRLAAASALRTGRRLGGLTVTVADRTLMPPARRLATVGIGTTKAIAKWLLI